MQIYIKISLFILLILGMVIILYDKFSYKFKISDLVLLLPFIMLIFAGDARLSSSFANNRVVNTNDNQKVEEKSNSDENTTIEEQKDQTNETKEKEIEYDFTNVDFNVIDASYYDLANYFTFVPKAKKYEGKTIRVRGFTLLNDSYIPNGYFMLGKYNISCCAADAIYVGFYIKNDIDVKDNTWYEIEGVLQSAIDTEGMETMAIKVINIKEIDAKSEEQYVYACYAYDNGKCSEVEKYDLSY